MTQIAIASAAIALVCLTAAAAADTVAPQAVSCKPIRKAAQLRAIQNDLDGSYCLKNDIDAGSIANFAPIGGFFRGRLFGNGKVIRNLTINSDAPAVGLFANTDGALIQDVGLVNVNISGTAAGAYVGGLVGRTTGSRNEIRRVHVTGRVAAKGDSSYVGGIVGSALGVTLTESWSSAAVNGAGFFAGGAVGQADGSGAAISRVYATGPVTCGAFCDAGGLVGSAQSTTVELSYASGPVAVGDSSDAGGLVGEVSNSLIRESHALGAVKTRAGSGYGAGGLIGHLSSGDVRSPYAVGRVSGGAGASLGGLVGRTSGGSVSGGYWDVNTSAQAASAAGAGYTTAQLRNALPVGFGSGWANTRNKSYPFLNEADIAFAAPLATLVKAGRVYTFLPAVQHDKSQYTTAPLTPGIYALATVYTMISRGIGVTRDIAALKTIKIDRFWNDIRKVAVWRGPAATLATLGTFKTIAGSTRLNNTNVIGAMAIGRLVILRGSYTRNGRNVEHWMLGTLYTTSGNALSAIIANDPWTGQQVTIDPASKTVVWPANYPLTGFKIDGYQPVTLN